MDIALNSGRICEYIHAVMGYLGRSRSSPAIRLDLRWLKDPPWVRSPIASPQYPAQPLGL
jgi:hypothetical protein